METFAKIRVVGVGGSGNSAINWMIQSKIKGVDFLAINTDAQALHHSLSPMKLHIGKSTTRGLGAGMDPELGKKAAEENQNEIRDALKGSDMVFITCGLGGGTGTGAAPIVADIAKDLGALTVAVVTRPFSFEGAQRRLIAEKGLQELSSRVDTIITIPNDRVFQIIDKKTTLLESFGVVNEVLRQGVQGISEVITVPGLINTDFADVKAIMKDAGSALMGIGESTGEQKATEAAKAAVASPLLEVSISGAKGLLFIITGGKDLTMQDVDDAAKVITEQADPNAKIIFGAVIDDEMKDRMKITVIATGFAHAMGQPVASQSRVGFPVTPPGKEFPATSNLPQMQRRTVTSPAAVSSQMQSRTSGQAARVAEDSGSEIMSKEDSNDDLEIPAFIRKKMGRS